MPLLYEQKSTYTFRKTRYLDFPPHLHDAVEIVYLKSGSSLFMHGTEKTLLRPVMFSSAFPTKSMVMNTAGIPSCIL